MPITFTAQVLAKLKDKHGVSAKEVEQCFANRLGGVRTDTREEHRTDPPTLWFIARTNRDRELKVVFVRRGARLAVKTAYEPNVDERYLYEKNS